jgi:hypothetical protein
MGQYKEEDLSRWRGLVSEQVASGKSVSAFCRERGLRVWPFYEWKKRLRKPDAAAFVAIEISRKKLIETQAAFWMILTSTPRFSKRLTSRLMCLSLSC